ISDWTIIGIVLIILCGLFFFQQFGTASIGKAFGPVMLTWFLMLGVFGTIHISDSLHVFKAFNPYHALSFLITYPKGFWVLGAVFLCTTGAEALYSDMGHCGRNNIHISWIFVKTCLILNYLGQGAWLVSHNSGVVWDAGVMNPFY